MIQSVFAPPPMSCRRKTSASTRNKMMNQAIQAKKISIVQNTSSSG